MKKSLYIITLIIVLILSLLTVNVNAANLKFVASLNASSTKVKEGEEVTVTISVSDFDDAEKGINTFSGNIECDTNYFETIKEDDIKGLNDWSVDYSESDGKLKLSRLKYATSKQDIAKITLKAKTNISNTNTKLELKDVVASNSDSELVSEDSSIDIEIEKASSNTNSSNNSLNSNTSNSGPRFITGNQNSNLDNNQNINRNIYNNINSSNDLNRNNNVSDYSNNTNESTEEEIPNTGLDDSIVKAILLIALLGAFGYIKFKSIDKK